MEAIFVGGYFESESITVGETILINNSSSGNSSDGMLIKYSSDGHVDWATSLGVENDDEIESIVVTADGGYMAVHRKSGRNTICKYNINNELEWSNITGERIIPTNDGGYIITNDDIIAKYNKNMEIQFETLIEGMTNIIQNSSGKYIAVVGPFNEDKFIAGDMLLENPENGKALLVELDEEVSASEQQEVIVENKLKTLKITTEVEKHTEFSETGEEIQVEGGAISTGIPYYEMVKYGKNAGKTIIMTPEEGYEIVKVTRNGEEQDFTGYDIDETSGGYIFPEITNVTEDQHIVVTYAKTESKLLINKQDENENPLAGAKFKIQEINTEREVSTDIIKGIEGKSQQYIVVDKTKDITNALGDKIDDEEAGYHFEQNEDGTYEPTNGRNYGDNNGEDLNFTTAHSYFEIDLTSEEYQEKQYAVVINARVSSEYYDYGYATITSETIMPEYDDSNGQFMQISEEVENKNYISMILEGGDTYYLHLGYYKDGSSSENEDRVVINSINIYEAEIDAFSFGEIETKYVSNNQGKSDTTANSYIPINLTDLDGKYDIIVNAQVSSAEGDYGYATISSDTSIPAHDDTDNRFIHISGTTSSVTRPKDYAITVEGNEQYYLHLGYYKDGEKDGGTDTFTVNSVKVIPSEEDLYKTEVTTDIKGQAVANLQIGKSYRITEIEAPEGYELSAQEIIHEMTVEGPNEVTIQNIKNPKLIVHHYKQGTGTDGVPAEKVAEDEEYIGKMNEEYKTEPKVGLERYELAKNEDGEPDIPQNAKGTYTEDKLNENGEIEVTYYYVQKKVPLIVHHYIEGTMTQVPLASGELATDKTQEGDEGTSYTTQAKTNNELDSRYELSEEQLPTNANGKYEYPKVEVTYYYKLARRKVEINKYAEDGETPLAGAKFRIEQVDEREVPANAIGTIQNNGEEYNLADRKKELPEGTVGEIVENGENYYYKDEDKNITANVKQAIQNNGQKYITNRLSDQTEILGTKKDDSPYYFVETEENGQRYYEPTNSENYEGNDGKNLNNTTAHSYFEINLTDGQYSNKDYIVVINARISSGATNRGCATITNTITIPSYSDRAGRFMDINGKKDDAEYTSMILEGGNTYYLHLEYQRGYGGYYEDRVVINSINIYEVETVSYYFEESENGIYKSNNQQKDDTQANSYIPIDLSSYSEQKIAVVVNAEISSETEDYTDYGYATITTDTERPSNDYSGTPVINSIYGEVGPKDYEVILDGGTTYYLHFAYYKDSSGYDGTDTFTINSVNVYQTRIETYDFGESEPYVSNNTNKINTQADSYIPIDLSRYQGKQIAVVVNAEISSKSGNYGYARIKNDIEKPDYNYDDDGITVIDGISGEVKSKDYTVILEGGKTYYLHLNYTKDEKTNEDSTVKDQFIINSVKAYEAGVIYGFDTTEDGKYISNNQKIASTVANSYIPINLRGYDDTYDVIVNAEISSERNNDFGYAVVTDSPERVDYNNRNKFINISGDRKETDYTVTLKGGREYYLHFGYVKNGAEDVGTDTFTINSIKVQPSGVYYGEVVTDETGKITLDLNAGKYTITEIEAPEGYEITSKVVEQVEINNQTDETVEVSIDNQKVQGEIIINHYIYDEEAEDPYTKNRVHLKNNTEAPQQIMKGSVGDIYITKQLDRGELKSGYKLYERPSNSSGIIQENPIEVNYYYVKGDVVIEHNITKDGTQIITSKDEEINYKIKYTAHIESYTGKAVVTITDTLPYKLDENKMQEVYNKEHQDSQGENWQEEMLNGGQYDREAQTITWTQEINVAEEESQLKTVEIEKVITVIFEGIDVKEKTIVNTVKGSIYLDTTKLTEETDIVEHYTQANFIKNVKVTKKWEHGANIYERPTAIKIYLKRAGSEDENVVDECELNNENNWEHTFTNLQKYDEETGEEIQYTVEEKAISGEEELLKYYKSK